MNKRRLVNRLIAVGFAAVLVVGSVLMASAGESLLSAGASKITADSSLNLCLDLNSLPDEMKAEGASYSVSLSISPSVSQISVKEGVGNLNPVNGEYQASSDELSGVTKLHFTIVPDTAIRQDTIYTVSASVVGDGGSVSDSITFTAVANPGSGDNQGDQNNKDQDANGPGNQNGNGNKMPGNGNTPANGATSGNGKAAGSTGSLVMSSGDSSSSTASVTYAGSWDNYLEELSVDGYEFTQKFNKTRDTYFITVPKGTEALSVSATPCDSSAVVAIAGNEDLGTGRNKIMVSVTADDGSVRIYRVYATVEAE